MKIYKTVRGLQNHLNTLKKQGKSIGFIPTMGALHDGHLSLVRSAQKKCDITVVSIFVNPTQFDDKKDLDKYPRVLEDDAQKLKSINTTVLFAPQVNQVYPKDAKPFKAIDLKGLDLVLEGEFRPGHFDGVVQVVKRLLDIVNPDKLFMGQKDFQQFTIIQHMIKHFKLKIKLVVVPIMREPNGLAMSSRNRRLSKKQREEVKIIFETLKKVKEKHSEKTAQQLQKMAMSALSKNYKPEYFKIIDGKTLLGVDDLKKHKYVVAVTAVWAHGVRLIDNMIIKK